MILLFDLILLSLSLPPKKIYIGEYGSTGSFVISGGMIGMWENAFGIRGLDFGDAVISIGVNPAMCKLGCISRLGLGATLR